MRVRDDEALVGIDDDAGTSAPELALARHRVRRQAEEAAEARIVEEGIAGRSDRAAHADVDDCRRHALDDRREGRLRRILRECGAGGGERGDGCDGREELGHGVGTSVLREV